MIYATALPIEEYSLTIDGYTLGLYNTYVDRPMLLALICMTTPVPFDYEGCREPGKRRVELGDSIEDALAQTLTTELCGRTVEEHLNALNPLRFHEMIESLDTIKLPSIDTILGGSETAFRMITSARATAWALNYRGRLPSQGKIMNVAFRGLVVSSEMRRNYEKLKKEFTE